MGVCPFGRHLAVEVQLQRAAACPGAACHPAVTPMPPLVLEDQEPTA